MTSSTATSNQAALPPELAGAASRDVRLTIGGLVVARWRSLPRWARWLPGLSGTLVYMRASDERQLRERGVEAEAVVVQVREAR
jgi:hypothetical protein